MKQIKVETCSSCPYKYDDNGGGHCEPFTICDKFNILLDEKYHPLNRFIELNEEIHPDCKLDDYKKKKRHQ